jgi:phosphate uptake regulator
MIINEKYLEDFKGITEYLTKDEVEQEIKDYIDLMFAVRDEDHFNEIYEAFLLQIS